MKAIKTAEDYGAALAQIDRLIALDPAPGTKEADDLDVLRILIREYENKQFPRSHADPVEAIVFRMDQLGLRQRDLVPYLGSRSRVSEILSRKRPLTVPMLRALRDGLGIPAEALLVRESDKQRQRFSEEELDKFPWREMRRRGWISSENDDREAIRGALRSFLRPLGDADDPLLVLHRKTEHVRSRVAIDRHALMAWIARVALLASSVAVRRNFSPDLLSTKAVEGLAHLSLLEDGPRLAREYLAGYGIAVVVLPHLKHTRLDGAAFLHSDGRGVIGLTIRYDRVDSFWFTLLHELAHLLKHVRTSHRGFVDDMDYDESGDIEEREADQFARDSLIPDEAWRQSAVVRSRHPSAARQLATELGIHPGIVAGRLRFETGSFGSLSRLVGQGQVRRLFADEFRELGQ
jgi:HTH-type transcriptional regulator / antitoxin HigA